MIPKISMSQSNITHQTKNQKYLKVNNERRATDANTEMKAALG